MRILFCQSLTYPFIGVMTISAVLKKYGHKTKLKIFNISKSTELDLAEIINYEPEIVAFPTYTGWQKPIIHFCRKLKDKINVITILGGPHPTYVPDVLLNDGIDYICVGEGEKSFLNFVEALENSKPTEAIAGIWYKKSNSIVDNGVSPLPDLDSLPSMDIDIYLDAHKSIKKLKHWEFSINRGCPYKCSYCNEPNMNELYKGHSLRAKSPELSIDEILHVYEKAKFTSCAFTSDNLFFNKSLAIEFLEKYKAKVNIPFYCQMRVELITVELARLLRSANCHYVTIGVESGSFRVRKDILRRQMSNEKIIKACRILQETGICINANNMMAIPGQTNEEAWETVSLNQLINPTTVWCSIFQPYPKTKLTDMLINRGEITTDIFDDIPATYFEKSVLRSKDIHIQTNLQRLFYFAVKIPWMRPLIMLSTKVTRPLNRLYDIFFLIGFMIYVKKAYKKSLLETIKTTFKNAIETFDA